MNRRDFFKIVPVLALAVSDKSVLKALQMRTYYGLIRPTDPISHRVKHVFLDGIDVLPQRCKDVNDEEGWVDMLGRDSEGRILWEIPRRHYGDVRVVLEPGAEPQMGGYVKPRGKRIVGLALDWSKTSRRFYPRTALKKAIGEIKDTLLR